MRERPILMNAPMVRAILSGAKTQTRRAIKPQPFEGSFLDAPAQHRPSFDEDGRVRVATSVGVHMLTCPFGQPGDRLWVRERFKPVASGQIKNGYGELRYGYGYAYEADSSTRWNMRTTIIHDLTGQPGKGPMQFQQSPWKSAICMPHRACRLVLEINAVRVERLQAITEADAIAEGATAWAGEQNTPIRDLDTGDERIAFMAMWNRAGGDWDSNPWVWVIEFKRVEVAGA